MNAPAVKAAAASLTEGNPAPAFDMPVDGGGRVSLQGLRGKRIVLYFYPKDDTPGCTIEAKDFRDFMTDFQALNTVVVGVSKDDLESHAAFKEKYCLPFPLASDEDGAVCDAYGTWGEKSMYGKTFMGIDRATFLIDEKGIVRRIWRKVKVDNHVKDVLEAIKAL
ncbi:MAG: thioredoxin-dependent thiol peroxidase [Alphaproteobacteria bacterium]|nr:thioredoxin-dependent thiol peroxidase [Alphaproteobacteria bacterium]